MFLYYLILSFVVAGFLIDIFLDYLNTTTWSNTVPEKLKGIYDEEKYLLQQKYQKANFRFAMYTQTLSFALILAMLFVQGFAYLDHWVQGITPSPVWQALLFFGILGFASDLLSTPFDAYHTFVIEERFGFNTTTVKTYMLDKLKGWLMAALLGGGIIAFLVWIYTETASWFWFWAWMAVTFFSIFLSYFYTVLILPLFNKLIPLEEGGLRSAIAAFAGKAGFNLKNIFVMDGSKRSTKGNAYFSGFGKQKKIVLFDTLIKEHTTEELVAVLAHEIGHYKKKHILTGLISSVVQTGIMFYVLSLLLGNPLLSEALGTTNTSFHIGVIAFGLLYSPISMILGVVSNVVSRRHEYQADRFAAETFSGPALANALKKLSVKNLSNLTPHPWYVYVHYSHPPLLSRLENLEAVEKLCVEV